MPLNIKLNSNLGLGLRPVGGARPVKSGSFSTTSFSKENQVGGLPRAQNFSVSRLNQAKDREAAKVSIGRVITTHREGEGRNTVRVGVGERNNQFDTDAEKRSQELEMVRQKAIDRQKFVATRHLVKERMIRDAANAKKAAEEKIRRQKMKIF